LLRSHMVIEEGRRHRGAERAPSSRSKAGDVIEDVLPSPSPPLPPPAHSSLSPELLTLLSLMSLRTYSPLPLVLSPLLLTLLSLQSCSLFSLFIYLSYLIGLGCGHGIPRWDLDLISEDACCFGVPVGRVRLGLAYTEFFIFQIPEQWQTR
jgi:hypothetical protein